MYENEIDTIKEEDQSNFDFNIYYSEAKIMTKNLLNNTNNILTIYIFLICVLLFFFIFGLSFESKNNLANNKYIQLSSNNKLFVSYDDIGKKLFQENKTLSFDY
jgi:ABC-type glycerol-3-phosphate transport system permease component